MSSAHYVEDAATVLLLMRSGGEEAGLAAAGERGRADLSEDLEASVELPRLGPRGKPASFIIALHAMLSVEDEGLLAILDDGTLVLADSKVVETSGILARYFKHNKVQSFMRQLYNFGFVRSPKGPRRGLPSYYQSSFTHPKVFATCRGPAAPALSPVARRDRFLRQILCIQRRLQPTPSSRKPPAPPRPVSPSAEDGPPAKVARTFSSSSSELELEVGLSAHPVVGWVTRWDPRVPPIAH